MNALTTQQATNLNNWIKDLRNTTTEQGQAYLTRFITNDGETIRQDCCLGRACTVMNVSFIETNNVYTYEFPGESNDEDEPWDKIVNKNWFNKTFGLDHSVVGMLWRLNDEKSFTFKQIADVLDALLLSMQA